MVLYVNENGVFLMQYCLCPSRCAALYCNRVVADNATKPRCALLRWAERREKVEKMANPSAERQTDSFSLPSTFYRSVLALRLIQAQNTESI